MSRLVEPLDAQVDRLTGDWRLLLDAWRASAPGRQLIDRVDARVRGGAAVYPADVFRALAATPLARTRVVILGQDPYHGAGQAEGLAFSVPPGMPPPPSLRNIFKELARDLGHPWTGSGHLGAWARQGVLLLNTALTVEDGQAASHSKFGWEVLTDSIVQAVARGLPTVFMLWGGHAQAKRRLLEGGLEGHLVLQSNHPSPLSATRPPEPFIGCGHFGLARAFVASRAGDPLDWLAT